MIWSHAIPHSRRWLTYGLLTLGLHYAWEMGQAPWFEEFAGTPWGEHALPCLRAAAGDLLIATAAFALTAALFRRWSWPIQPGWRRPALVWIGTGLVATVVFEHWAVLAGRWTYTASMPTIAGIGVLPLLQWIVVPVVTLALLRLAGRPCEKA